jgi:hypothetical protein
MEVSKPQILKTGFFPTPDAGKGRAENEGMVFNLHCLPRLINQAGET